jgi:hypothetical protein
VNAPPAKGILNSTQLATLRHPPPTWPPPRPFLFQAPLPVPRGQGRSAPEKKSGIVRSCTQTGGGGGEGGYSGCSELPQHTALVLRSRMAAAWRCPALHLVRRAVRRPLRPARPFSCSSSRYDASKEAPAGVGDGYPNCGGGIWRGPGPGQGGGCWHFWACPVFRWCHTMGAPCRVPATSYSPPPCRDQMVLRIGRRWTSSSLVRLSQEADCTTLCLGNAYAGRHMPGNQMDGATNAALCLPGFRHTVLL